MSSFTVKPHTPAWPVLASLSPFFLGGGVGSDPSVIVIGASGGGLVLRSLGAESMPGMMDCIDTWEKHFEIGNDSPVRLYWTDHH